MIMAQAGQYNLPRCLQRGNATAAMLAAARFSEAALSMALSAEQAIHAPSTSGPAVWLKRCPILGQSTVSTLNTLAGTPWSSLNMEIGGSTGRRRAVYAGYRRTQTTGIV